MVTYDFDLIIIGAGPGGYVAGVRAKQLGMNVAVIEREHLGGICLNWGCIPTKALLKSAEVYSFVKDASSFGIEVGNIAFDFSKIITRSRQIADRMAKGVQFLFKKNNIEHILGNGRLIDDHTVAIIDKDLNEIKRLTSKNIILATGARPRSVPGIAIDGKYVISSKEAMSLESMPQSMVIIGAGAIGIEFAHFYSTLGCKVSIIEMMPQILPNEDKEVVDVLNRVFRRTKVDIHTNSQLKWINKLDSSVQVVFNKAEKENEIQADVALMAIGVQGNYENLGLDELSIAVDRSFIKVNDKYQTNVKNIYAIGDIIGPPLLAHVASAEGINVVERIAGLAVDTIDYKSIPGCTYCSPQIASIGMTEATAVEKGLKIKIGRFPFIANGKSIALGEKDGLVKIIFDYENGKILGAHIAHAEATELIGEIAVAMKNNLTAHDIIKSVHAHPTLSEAIMEAAAAAYGEAIHV